MNRAARFLFAGFLSVAMGAAVAETNNIQFSAEAVQSTPDKNTRHAQIYVGDNQVRLEYQQDKRIMVEIYDMKNQRALLLIPEQMAYMERKVPGDLANPMLPPSDMNPCARVPNAQCKQLGNESLQGRPVNKWEMVLEHEGKTLRSLHWIDVERHMPLRQLWPDGTVMEMQLLDKPLLNGRVTERWQMTTTRPDGESLQSTQWYDPQLKISIREELPGGFFRELRNIQVAPQPERLFMVPAGYRLMSPPQTPPAGDAPQQPAPYPQAPYPGR